ncbi:MAG: hypothetical protein PF508_07545 [Spirochaeta sp.]|jgi:hypothetical protein|nr:hypothetical protein [Spirochaeta sp.]
MPETRIIRAVSLLVGIVLFAAACTSSPDWSAGTTSSGNGASEGDNIAPDAAAADSGNPAETRAPDESPAPVAGTAPAALASADPSVPTGRAAPSVPSAVPISTAGIPLAEVMPPTPGLRLEYRLVRTGVPAAETVALVVQPSRDAWANLAVHGSTTDGHAPAYVIMGQDETTWYPDARVHFGENAGDDPAPILGAVPWPRFLPSPDEAYRFETVGISAGVQPDDIDGSWSLAYQIADAYEYGPPGAVRFTLAPTVAEPSELSTVAPTLFSHQAPDGTELRYELVSAVVYRERMITGVVVNTVGRPQRGFAVAPHPAVGRLPEQHRSITGPNGLFTLAYRGAPGDTIRLFYGPVTGQGYNARITDPLEITGRIRSPDFATLIYERP